MRSYDESEIVSHIADAWRIIKREIFVLAQLETASPTGIAVRSHYDLCMHFVVNPCNRFREANKALSDVAVSDVFHGSKSRPKRMLST